MVTLATMRLRERTKELRAILGNACTICGATERLCFDCIIPQGWIAHGNGGRARLRFYWQQHLGGNLQLLCHTCNCSKAFQDSIILRRARSSAAALSAALTGETPTLAPKSTASPAPSTTAPTNETAWERKCRLARNQWGIQ